ncbi:unnamed protein product [Lymnaea stagnalis]|uniref:Uncharacterized protein n=1 Tax=Lymnaea stagnalis TaxID=6523 RepID=A0AAV2H2D4_LYMST
MRHDSCSLACQAKFNSSVLSGQKPCAVSDVTTHKPIQELSCPDDRPNYWPPGICCRDDEFGQDGRCVSCFPDDIGENDLLSWCQTLGRTNTTRMPRSTCRFACNARFEPSQLLVINDTVDGWMVAFIITAILCAGLLAVICLQDNFSNKTKTEKNEQEVGTNDHMTPPIDRRMQRSLSHEERSRSLLSLREISTHEN